MSQQLTYGNQPRVIHERPTVLDVKRKEDPDSVVWYKYKQGTIVWGSDTQTGKEEPSNDIILNLKPHFDAKQAWEDGKISWDKYITTGYKKEFRDAAYQLHSKIDESHEKNENLLEAAAAVIRPEHFAPLISTAINEVIISIAGTNHNLLQTVKTVEMDKLNERYILDIKDNGHKIVSHDIGEEGLPAEIGPYPYEAKSIDLMLNGTKLTLAGTFKLTAFDFDVLSPFATITENAIVNDKHQMVADILNGSGFTSAPVTEDWDEINATTGRPLYKAYKQIGAYKTLITKENKGAPNWIASPLTPYEAYLDNSNLLGQNVTGPVEQNTYEDSNFVASNVPRVAGFRWVVDDMINDDSVVVYNSQGIYFAQGPRRSSTISNSITGNFGSINLEYYKMHLVFPNLIKRYTAVTTA